MIHVILESVGLTFLLFSGITVLAFILDRAIQDGTRGKSKVVNLWERSKRK